MPIQMLYSNSLVTYLVATNTGNGSAQVNLLHSAAKYSADFGGSNVLHGRTLALLGEAIGDQLPMMVRFNDDPTENLTHALVLESVIVPTKAQVDANFAAPTAGNLMTAVTVLTGVVEMRLACLCPIPHAWAPYFLKPLSPTDALTMGRQLIATLIEPAARASLEPLTDWLRAACVRFGPNQNDRTRSVMDVGFESVTPDARVVKWMQRRLTPHLLPVLPPVVPPAVFQGSSLGAPVLSTGALSRAGEREYSQLETAKI
jgi:hypothetical protein